MKKMLLLASAALVWLSQPGNSAVTLPYESDMASEGSGWTVVNVVEGSPGFTKGSASDFSASAYTGGTAFETGFVYLNKHMPDTTAAYPVDDWLISPGFELKAGVAYKVTWRVKANCQAGPGTSWVQSYKTVAAKGNTVDELKNGAVVFDYNKETNLNNWGKGYAGGRGFANPPGSFTPTEDGVYYFGIHFYEQHYDNECISISFTGFRVSDLISSITPKKVEDFYAFRDTIAPNRVLSHIIPFRLDTVDVEGVKLPDQIKYTNVKFYREGKDEAGQTVRTLFKTIENPVVGKTQWFTDDETTGLTPGKHKLIAISELSNGKTSPEASYTMDWWVGPVDSLPLPWSSNNFKSIDLKKDWLDVRGNTENAKGNWAKSSTSIAFTPSSNKPEDQYLILPPFKFEKAGLYQLLSSVQFGNKNQTLEVYAVKGTPTTYEAFTEDKKIGDITTTDTYKHNYFNAFEITEPGQYTIAIRRYSTKAPASSKITISMLGVEETAIVPAPIADLKGEVIDEKAHLTWTNPTKNNVGKDIEAFSKIDILRISNLKDTTVISLTKDILPGAKMEYNDSVEKPWLYNYVVLPYIGDATHPQPPVNAFTANEWIGSMLVDLPYTVEMLSGHQQDITEPFQKLTLCERDATAYNTNFGVYSASINLSISRGKTYGHRFALPPMQLKKGNYKAIVTLKGGMADMPLKFSYRNENDTTKTLKGKVDFDTKTYSTSYHESEVTIKVEDDSISRFIISLEGTLPTTGSYGQLMIKKIHIEYIPEIPAAVSDLTVTPDSTGARKATLEWTNPTKSSNNGDVPALTKAVVYRNGTNIAELTEGLEAGKKMTYTDSVPDAGIFTYKVEIYSQDGCSPATEVRSEWIGDAKDVPYTATDYTEWNIPAASGWSIVDGHAYYQKDDEVTDDWGFTPPLKLENAYYIIEFRTWFNAAWEEVALSLNYGNDQKKESMTSLGEFRVTGEGESNATVERFYIKASDDTQTRNREIGRQESEYITIPAGKMYFGFNAKAGGSANISDFKVYTYVPSGVEDINANNGIVCAGNTLLLPEGSDVVVTDLSGKVVLSANGVNSLNISGLAKGVYVVSVSADSKHFVTKIMK